MKGELKIDGFYFYCHKYLDDERTSKASKDVLQLTRRILPIKPMSFKKLFQCDCNFEERTYEHYRCLFIRLLHRTSPVASGFRMCQRSVDYRGVESPISTTHFERVWRDYKVVKELLSFALAICCFKTDWNA